MHKELEAIPFLLGYVAATDDFGLAAGTLFAKRGGGKSVGQIS